MQIMLHIIVIKMLYFTAIFEYLSLMYITSKQSE